jgi:hypothetical protein
MVHVDYTRPARVIGDIVWLDNGRPLQDGEHISPQLASALERRYGGTRRLGDYLRHRGPLYLTHVTTGNGPHRETYRVTLERTRGHYTGKVTYRVGLIRAS